MCPAAVPIVTTAAGLAYDQVVSKPSRDKAANDAKNISERAYNQQMEDFEWRKAEAAKQEATRKEYLAKLEAFTKSLPDTGYDQKMLDTKLGLVKAASDKQYAEQRPQVLDNLATRGVRSSGIGEYSLNKLDVARAGTMDTATSNFTIEQLIADRAAKTAKNNAIMSYYQAAAASPGTPLPALPDSSGLVNAQINQANQPLVNNAVIQALLQQAGQGIAYGMTTPAPAQPAQPTTWTSSNPSHYTGGFITDTYGNISAANPGARTY